MASPLNLSLTDELRAFVDQNPGYEKVFTTPSEFIGDLLREEKNRQEAAPVRDSILEGYHDGMASRTVAFEGNLQRLLKKTKKIEAEK